MGSIKPCVVSQQENSGTISGSANDNPNFITIVENTANLQERNDFRLIKVQITQDILDARADSLKLVVNTIKKISKCQPSSQTLFTTYNKVWLEGPLSKKCITTLDLDAGGEVSRQNSNSEHFQLLIKPTDSNEISASAETEEVPTYLFISRENYKRGISLEDWLKEREDEILYEGQILHILVKVLRAIQIMRELKITKSTGMSFGDVQVSFTHDNDAVRPHNVHDILPKIKLTNLDYEVMLRGLLNKAEEPFKASSINTCSLKAVADMLSNILQHNLIAYQEQTTQECSLNAISTTFPSESEITEEIKAMSEKDNDEATLQNIITKLEKLKEKYTITGRILNVNEPKKIFVGRDELMKQAIEALTCNDKKLGCVIQGSSGCGKSELVNQITRSLLTKNTVQSCMVINDASSGDNVINSVWSLASKLNVLTRDHAGNPRLIKNIFQDIISSLSSCGESGNLQQLSLLIIIKNAQPTEELSDLLQVFDPNENYCSQERQYLILTSSNTEWNLNNNNVLKDIVTILVPTLTQMDSLSFLDKSFGHRVKIPSLDEMEEFSKTLEINSPAALQLMASFVRDKDIKSCQQFFQSVSDNLDKYPDLKNLASHLQPICGIYLTSLMDLFESLNDIQDKELLQVILKLLSVVNGNIGISVDDLTQFLPKIIEKCEDVTKLTKSTYTILESLTRLSLIQKKNGLVYLTTWMQDAMKESYRLANFQSDSNSVSSNFQCFLQGLKSYLEESKSGDSLTVIIPHATKMWISLTRNDAQLTKQFDNLPELIVKKANKSLLDVTGFLRQSSEILTAAYGTYADLRVLKLKYLLAKESLLPRSKLGEAFAIFKIVNEQSRTEPREFLMLKLNCLINLGEIHIIRQQYEKAISCFQQVQIFAAQKISLLELDSEPTLLKSRVLHGHAHYLQNNYDEAKKILLHVIPLLERYKGAEEAQIKKLTTQAKFYLATLLRKMGDLVNALMMQTKVLKEREKSLGAKHPDTWASKQEMAMLFSSYDNHEKALAILKQVLDIQEQVLGAPSNRLSLSTMIAIAEVEAKLGNFEGALELYEAIDLIQQQVLDDSDEMRVSTQISQADVLIALGQYKEAMDILDLIYAIKSSSSTYINNHVATLCESILGTRERVERSMEIMGDYWLTLSPDTLDLPPDMERLGKKHEVAMELSENQDNHGALRLLREVLDDCEHLDDTNRFHLNVKADLARVLGLVGKFNESFSVYKEIIPLMDATFGETDEQTMLCKDTMGQVFLFSGNQYLKRQMSNLKWFMM